MKTDGIDGIDKKSIGEMATMGDDELDAMFYHSLSSDSLGFDGTVVKDAIRGINYFLEKNDDRIKKTVCHNEIVNKFILGDEANRIDLLVAVASLLAVWLPPMAALAAAEGLLRVGLSLYCKSELKNPSYCRE